MAASDGASAPTGVILAGGRSSRMGRPKALVELVGRPLIRHVASRLADVCGEMIVAADDPLLADGVEARVVADERPGAGPVGGLAAGLAASRSAVCVVVGCDMPLLDPEVLRLQLWMLGPLDAVVLSEDAGPVHPLHGVYRQSCVHAARAVLDSEEASLLALLHRVRTLYVPEKQWRAIDPQGLSVMNVNSTGDLAHAEALLRARG